MSPDFNVVHEGESVRDAGERMLRSGIPAIPIVDGDRHFKGVIGYEDIVSALVVEGDVVNMKADQLEPRWVAVDQDATLNEATRMIATTGIQPLPVLEDSVLVGVLSHFDLVGHARLTEMGLAVSDIEMTISPHDLMWQKQQGPYLVAGASALTCIRTAMEAARKERVAKILDLGCGHGRILRFLKVHFKDAYFAASDLDRDAVDFCAETFGVTPIYSDEDPSKVEIDDRFDLIWSGSLLTHLEKGPWLGFFDLAVRSLTADGLFVFTTHGRHDRKAWRSMNLSQEQIDEVLAGYDREGFGYSAYEEDVNYGLTAVSPDWVGSEIEKRPGIRLVMHLKNGWEPPAPPQDVYVVSAAT
jgi:SAM-dependent methyltransferase